MEWWLWWHCRSAVVSTDCGDAPHKPAEPPGWPAASLGPAALGSPEPRNRLLGQSSPFSTPPPPSCAGWRGAPGSARPAGLRRAAAPSWPCGGHAARPRAELCPPPVEKGCRHSPSHECAHAFPSSTGADLLRDPTRLATRGAVGSGSSSWATPLNLSPRPPFL